MRFNLIELSEEEGSQFKQDLSKRKRRQVNYKENRVVSDEEQSESEVDEGKRSSKKAPPKKREKKQLKKVEKKLNEWEYQVSKTVQGSNLKKEQQDNIKKILNILWCNSTNYFIFIYL